MGFLRVAKVDNVTGPPRDLDAVTLLPGIVTPAVSHAVPARAAYVRPVVFVSRLPREFRTCWDSWEHAGVAALALPFVASARIVCDTELGDKIPAACLDTR